MIYPEDELPPDDTDGEDTADQQSQEDIHSNGLDETPAVNNTTDADILKQSYDAAESAYTLKLGGEGKPKKE
jgi:hypothetical protein